MAVPVCIETPTEFARYTVSNATAIPLSTTMKMLDPHAAIASSAEDVFAGMAWEEKTASDGITELSVAKNGVWDMQATAAAITAGAMVKLSGANLIVAAVAADLLTGKVVGKAEETASASEVIRVRVGRVV